jgi:hypothetical protein
MAKKITDWRCLLMSKEERKVFEALDRPEWEWRTLDGLVQDTGLTRTCIVQALTKFHDQIKMAPHPQKGIVFQLKHRTNPVQESTMEQFIDLLSAGRNKRLA